MSDYRKAVREAYEIYRRNEALDEYQRREALARLEGHGVWSLAHMAAILGVSRGYLRTRVHKRDRTGGRFNPDTLELILEEFALKDRGERNPYLTLQIVSRGTSTGFLGRLLGLSASSVAWRMRDAA